MTPDKKTTYRGYPVITPENPDEQIQDLFTRAGEIRVVQMENITHFDIDGIDRGRTPYIQYRFKDVQGDKPGPLNEKYLATVLDGGRIRILVPPENVHPRENPFSD